MWGAPPPPLYCNYNYLVVLATLTDLVCVLEVMHSCMLLWSVTLDHVTPPIPGIAYLCSC